VQLQFLQQIGEIVGSNYLIAPLIYVEKTELFVAAVCLDKAVVNGNFPVAIGIFLVYQSADVFLHVDLKRCICAGAPPRVAKGN
jgi:hypothetical protein